MLTQNQLTTLSPIKLAKLKVELMVYLVDHLSVSEEVADSMVNAAITAGLKTEQRTEKPSY